VDTSAAGGDQTSNYIERNMVRSLIFFLLLSSVYPAQAFQDVDKSYLKSIVKTLASDSMQGRYTGTDGIERAAKFIEKSFQEAGLTDVRREEFTVLESGWSEVYLRSGDKKFLCPNDIMIHGNEHINTEIGKELVFAGTGTKDELKQVNVKGRIVLIFLSNMRASFDVSRELQKLGAFALIVANPDNQAQFESIRRGFTNHVMAKRFSLERRDSVQRTEPWDTLRTIPVIDVGNYVIPVLMKVSMKSLSRSIKDKTLKDIPVTTIGFKSEFKVRPIRTSNIIAHLPGLVDTAIVVSAHYDHMGQSGTEIFHGADDNASGTAGMIALAKEFAKAKSLKYSLTFVAMTGEEVGLLGSRYHTTTKNFDPRKVVFNLNLDMIGSIDSKHTRTPYIYVISHSDPPPMNDLFEEVAKENKIILDYSENGTIGYFQRGDQYSFYRAGVPAIHLFSGLHERYHKDSDRWEMINYPMLEMRVEYAGKVLTRMVMK
jgi:hypothetical protein